MTVDEQMLRRGQHPRPQMQRDEWRSLDGEWQFAFDDTGRFVHPSTVHFDRTITVPFPPECAASGINDPGYHRSLWYRREVTLSPEERQGTLLLHFGAVDYHAKVWVNQRLVAEHRGGHTPFTADISEARREGETIEIVVRAEDDPHDLAKPRGKQDWLAEPIRSGIPGPVVSGKRCGWRWSRRSTWSVSASRRISRAGRSAAK